MYFGIGGETLSTENDSLDDFKAFLRGYKY
jgi:hypothetical protein